MRQIWYGIGASVELTALAVTFVAALVLATGWGWVKYGGGSWRRYGSICAAIALFVEVVGVFAITLSPTYAVQERSNYLPLADAIKAISHGTGIEIIALNLAGNTLMFLPLGLLLPFCFLRMRAATRILFFSALLSTLIELTQKSLIVGRAFDINDIIFNSLGALIGCALLGAIAKISSLIKPTRKLSSASPPR